MGKEYNILLFSGGGIKGIAYIGVFKKLEEFKKKKELLQQEENYDENKCKLPILKINRVCAVSVGSIFSLIYLLNYTYDEMLEEVLKVNFDILKNIKIINLASKYGLDNGVLLMNWICGLMEKKDYNKEITLLELYNKTNVRFDIMATNLNKYTYKSFNYIDTPDVKVIDAIKMSISIPFIYTINEYEDDIYVDGGVINNYPIEMFTEDLEKLIGFKLINHGELESHTVDEEINNIEDYIYHVLTCFMIQKEKEKSKNVKYYNSTVYIPTNGLKDTLNFKISKKEKMNLINTGYKQTELFFAC